MGINEKLQDNDVLVKIEYNWYRLDSVSIDEGTMPIVVSDEDDNQYTHWDMADVDEMDSPVENTMDSNVFGIS